MDGERRGGNDRAGRKHEPTSSYPSRASAPGWKSATSSSMLR
jgi:hypothetical protein